MIFIYNFILSCNNVTKVKVNSLEELASVAKITKLICHDCEQRLFLKKMT